MTKCYIEHDECWNNSLAQTSGQNEEENVRDNNRDEVVNPLFSDGELKEKCSEEEGKEMLHLSVWEARHDHSKRVAYEHTQSVAEGLHIKSDSLREAFNLCSNESRYCGRI